MQRAEFPPNQDKTINQFTKGTGRNSHQRPHRRRKRLVAISAVRRDRDGDRELEVVACGGEGLRCGQAVGEAHAVAEEEGQGEDEGEVED